MTEFTAGFVQMDVRSGDTETNVAAAAAGLQFLAGHGVGLGVLPEMFSCGFDNDRLAAHAAEAPEIVNRLSALASGLGMVIAGSLPEIEDGRVYNALYVLDADGAVAGIYRKIHLFTPTGEHRFFAPGGVARVCDTRVGRLGLMICYDLRFPELCRTLALKGADLVIVPAQWPLVRIEHWRILSRARAIENQLPLVVVNRCGTENRTTFGGHSAVLGPAGEILVEAGQETTSGFAVIDPARVAAVRDAVPSFRERMPSAYEL